MSTNPNPRKTPAPGSAPASASANAPAQLNARACSPSTHGKPTDRYVGLTGAQIFHEMMREHEVKVMFGYPGGAILPVFDAIHESPHFQFILSRHEQGAGHMAE